MQWSPEYATGIERLDEQHRMIFTMAEDFRTALNSGRGERVYAGLLKSLDLYIRSHFGYEEKCMAEYKCPVAGRNKEAHAKFAQVLRGFQERHETGVFDPQEGHRLVDTLDKWLASHICRIDVRLREVVG